jgi:hypothetical protein
MTNELIQPGAENNLSPEAFDPRKMGWNTIAELLLDISGFLPKPQDPTGTFDESDLAHISASEAEAEIVSILVRGGRTQEMRQFKKQMTQYRDSISFIVTLWRTKGLL